MGRRYALCGNNIKNSLKFQEKALNILLHIEFLNRESFLDTNILNSIGCIYLDKADYLKALKYFDKALEAQIEIFGGDNNSNTS